MLGAGVRWRGIIVVWDKDIVQLQGSWVWKQIVSCVSECGYKVFMVFYRSVWPGAKEGIIKKNLKEEL